MNSLPSIISKLKKFAPLSLAGNWDNVGLLVEPSPPKFVSKIMLTNDLTMAVMEEAKAKTVDLILSYHPPIFAPLKRLTQSSWKQRLIIECMENRIALYSPHTSYDALDGGVNDWLISAFDIKKHSLLPIEIVEEFQNNRTHLLEVDLEPSQLKDVRDEVLVKHLDSESRLRKKDAFTIQSLKSNASNSEMLRLQAECNKSELERLLKGLLSSGSPEKYTVSPLSKGPIPGTGPGRKANLSAPISLETAVKTVKNYLHLDHVSVARVPGNEDDAEINSVAVCAGSGASVLRGVSCDLYVTGEMSHHEVLDAIHNGSHVILCRHSNTERGYLLKLQNKLLDLFGSSIEVFVSEEDREPLDIV